MDDAAKQKKPVNFPRRIKGVIFDFDGTLYGDWNLWTRLIVETLEEFQVTVNQEQALEKAGRMITDSTFYNISGIAIALARDHGIRDRDLDVRRRFLERLDVLMDYDGPDPRLVETLRKFQESGIRMGIVTFQRMLRLQRRLDVWNLRRYFTSLVTPDDVPEFKPSLLPFTKAAGEMGVAPGECLVVGDELVDIIGAKKAGMFAVGLPNGFFPAGQLKEAGADFTVGSIPELARMLLDEPASGPPE